MVSVDTSNELPILSKLNGVTMVELLELPHGFREYTVKFRVGLLMLSTDHTAELEFARLVHREQIGIYVNRVPFANPTTPKNLRAMLPHIADATDMLLPDSSFDVIYYGCTSASVVIGDEAIIDAVTSAKPGTPVITPTLAARNAFEALGVSRIALFTPYLPETSKPMGDYFTRNGLEVVRHSCLGMEDDREMARLNSEFLIEAALAADHDDAEALFMSCTALRSLEVAGTIERQIGKPVVTSNQAAVWQCLEMLKQTHTGKFDCLLFNTRYAF